MRASGRPIPQSRLRIMHPVGQPAQEVTQKLVAALAIILWPGARIMAVTSGTDTRYFAPS